MTDEFTNSSFFCTRLKQLIAAILWAHERNRAWEACTISGGWSFVVQVVATADGETLQRTIDEAA